MTNLVRHMTEDMLVKTKTGWRLTTQNLTIGQQQILDGAGLETNWVESAIAIGASRYAEFTVPAGVKMILALRILNPSGDNFLYRVFPQGTYTIGAAKADDDSNFAFTRNLRDDSGLVVSPLVRHNVTALPANSARIIYEPVWGQVNAGNRSVGTFESDDSYLILSQERKFLLEMKNNGTTNPMSAQVKLQYAFIPVSQVSDSRF